MKKLLKFIFILIGVVVVLVIVAVVGVCIAVRDGTDNTPADIAENNIAIEQIISREAVTALDDAENKNVISLLLDEHTLNEIAYAAVKNLDIPFVKAAGAYVGIDEQGALGVEIPLRIAGVVPTCIKATVKITYEDNVLKVTVERADIGNFSLTNGLVRALILTSPIKQSVTQALDQAGILGEVDFDTLSFTASADQLTATVENLTSSDPNTLLYSIVCDFALSSPNVLTFCFGDNGLYGVTLNVERLSYDQTADGQTDYPLDVNEAKESALAFAGNGLNQTNASALFRYYLSGYKTLTDDQKSQVEKLGLGDNGQGVRDVSAITMAEVLARQSGGVTATVLNRAVTVSVTQSDMNTVFAGLDIIGAGSAFYDDNTLAFIALESIDVNIDDQNMQITVVLNVNGKRICGFIDADCPDTDKLSLDAKIKTVRLGKEVMSDRRVKLFLTYLGGVLAEEQWISADAERSVIIIDMEALFTSITEYAELFNLNAHVKAQMRSVYSEGQLQFVFRLI